MGCALSSLVRPYPPPSTPLQLRAGQTARLCPLLAHPDGDGGCFSVPYLYPRVCPPVPVNESDCGFGRPAGIFVNLSVRKPLVIDYNLPYPTGTATGLMINSFLHVRMPLHLPLLLLFPTLRTSCMLLISWADVTACCRQPRLAGSQAHWKCPHDIHTGMASWPVNRRSDWHRCAIVEVAAAASFF